MNIDEVIEYLSDKTDRDFNKDKTIKLIEEKKIPIVFQYQGWGTYEFNHERKYQSLNIEVDGYFRFRNTSDAMSIFKGFLTEIAIHEAIIYHLNSYRIRGSKPDGIEPRKGDDILFKTGGRSPMFIHPNTQSFIKIDNNKAGVLKVDLEKYLDKMQINYVDNKTKIETLESEIKRLKSENATLVQQHTETLTAANAKIKQQDQDINSLNDQLSKQADTNDLLSDRSEKSYQTTIGLLLELMFTPKGTDSKQPFSSQTVIINKIADKGVYGQGKSTLETRFGDANTVLNNVKKKRHEHI